MDDEATYSAKLDPVTAKVCEIEVQNAIATASYAA
jgi:hypothetical protein